MRVLAINCGSSTLKFKLSDHLAEREAIAEGIVDGVPGEARIEFRGERMPGLQSRETVADHGEATGLVIRWLEAVDVHPDAVGQRVVHGGDSLIGPAVVDADVIRTIEALEELAPLHNRPALASIGAVTEAWPSVPVVATFDTAFHATLPEVAGRYAIPRELAERHRIRRYGFHGLAHRYMSERYAELVGCDLRELKLVTFQLGAGCSAAAVVGGRSVDTSMGLTPLEGLIMATRSGDLDPALPAFLAEREGVSAERVGDWLVHRSGLLGLSGRSGDLRELLAAEAQGDAASALAIDAFCYRARKYLGAYLATLGGADAVLFGGGVGEHQPQTRARICAGMEWAGLALDASANAARVGGDGPIGSDGAGIAAHVIAVDEEAIIVRDTFDAL